MRGGPLQGAAIPVRDRGDPAPRFLGEKARQTLPELAVTAEEQAPCFPLHVPLVF